MAGNVETAPTPNARASVKEVMVIDNAASARASPRRDSTSSSGSVLRQAERAT